MKVLQFGEGNFLRCFFDWMLQKMSDATGEPFEAIVVQPLESGQAEALGAADGFHVLLRGYESGGYREILDRVSVVTAGVNPFVHMEQYLTLGCDPEIRVVVSNTTEAGIFYDPGHTLPHNYPSLLAVLLHKRQQAGLPPLALVPMELIEHNSRQLKHCLAAYGQDFGYNEAFAAYVAACPGYDTLVDRIVPGFPISAAKKLSADGHPAGQDPFLTSGELFHLLVLEGQPGIEELLPFSRAGLNVIVTQDQLAFYRDRKVRVLNGAHTASVPMALFAGIEEVDRFAASTEFKVWLRDLMHDEIVFALESDHVDSAETHAYADEVLTRFLNPSLAHKFRTIALNSIAKSNTRLRPTLEAYWAKTGKVPPRLTQSIRKMIALYSGPQGVQAHLPGGSLTLSDFADLKGATTPETILERLFPGLDPTLAKAVLA